MRNPKQIMRYTDEELGLIKAMFADNDSLLFIIRKVMLQFELEPGESAVIRSSITGTVFALLTKTFNPDLDPDSPIFQMTDLILGLGADIKSLSPDGAWPFIKAKELEIEFIEQQLKVLNGEEVKITVKLSDLADLHFPKTGREQVYINITARNFLLSFVDSNINQLKILAGLKSESVEETLERLKANSNK